MQFIAHTNKRNKMYVWLSEAKNSVQTKKYVGLLLKAYGHKVHFKIALAMRLPLVPFQESFSDWLLCGWQEVLWGDWPLGWRHGDIRWGKCRAWNQGKLFNLERSHSEHMMTLISDCQSKAITLSTLVCMNDEQYNLAPVHSRST